MARIKYPATDMAPMLTSSIKRQKQQYSNCDLTLKKVQVYQTLIGFQLKGRSLFK